MKALRPLSYIAEILRFIVGLIALWPILVIGLFLALPTGPHLLWSYDYRYGSRPHYGAPPTRIYTRCTYLGSRGLIIADLTPDCPWVAILNARDGRKP